MPGTRTAAKSREPGTKRRATEARLVAAAHVVFASTTYNHVRITDITAQAEVASGTFYNYFDDKEAIFRKVAADVLDELWKSPRRHPDNPEHDPVQDVAWASRCFLETCLLHRKVLRSIEQLNSTDAGVAGTRRQALLLSAKRAARWIERLQENGTCDPTLDAWHTAVALQAMNISMAYDQLVLRDEPAETDIVVTTVTRVWAKTVGLD